MTASAQTARGRHAHHPARSPDADHRRRSPARHSRRHTNPYNVSWAALNPGNDWAAQVLQLPVPDPRRNRRHLNRQRSHRHRPDRRPVHRIHRGDRLRFRQLQHHHEHPPCCRNLADPRQRPDLDVRRPHRLRRHHDVPSRRRLLRRPAVVMQSAMWGVGMAKALYTNAIQAVGPDAAVIAQPDDARHARPIVAGLVDNELCMDLVNLAVQHRGRQRAAGARPRSRSPSTTMPAAATSPGATAYRPTTSPAIPPAAPSPSVRAARTRARSPASPSIWRLSNRPC